MKSVQQKLVNLLKSPRRMNAFLSAGIILGIFAYGVGIISTTVYIADAKSDSRSIAELESDIAGVSAQVDQSLLLAHANPDATDATH